ncbi:MAG: amidohydrolase family protein [Bacteroidales bacterium]
MFNGNSKYLLISVITYVAISIFVWTVSCRHELQYYSTGDFTTVPKTDAHFHYLSADTSFIVFAKSVNFRLLSPIWEGEIPIDTQLSVSAAVRAVYPSNYAFFTSFPTSGILKSGFADSAIAYIARAIQKGATGVKIWKNIGMVLTRPDSSFIMADDEIFDPVFSFLEENHIPVIGHLGEPRNCWLPFDKMTDRGDSMYYAENPKYHMFLHPKVPSYEKQITAIEHLLEKHPLLDYTGAHLASLEWSVDEVAIRLDRFPNLKVDLAARLSHIQAQSDHDWKKVRNFFIKYQDRLVYGTDYEVHGAVTEASLDNLENAWHDQWNYLATDTCRMHKGLKLPREVIDKIYFKNSMKCFTINAR